MISIHALHEESDDIYMDAALAFCIFQSTLSMRRATIDGLMEIAHAIDISIHALHEESDRFHRDFGDFAAISIHALHEESDLHPNRNGQTALISIHALHEESDRSPCRSAPPRCRDFNPRSP